LVRVAGSIKFADFNWVEFSIPKVEEGNFADERFRFTEPTCLRTVELKEDSSF
jgi:hypothetical protein